MQLRAPEFLFIIIYNKILRQHALVKKKPLRKNQGKFMTKKLNKAITSLSRLRKQYLKEKNVVTSKIACDTQRIYCANILGRTKQRYFPKINITSITDNN